MVFRRLRRSRKEPGDLSEYLITMADPNCAASESYKTLRTNLFYSVSDTPPKVIVLTSHSPREGKSTTCANLAVVLAQAEKRVLIVDCDLRKPVMHKIFGLRNIEGLMNILAEERSLQEVWEEPLGNLKVLTVGPIPPNPAEVLSSQRFMRFLDKVRQEFDYVLLDAPPTRLVSDPIALASEVDGVLLVLDAQNTGKGAVRESLRSLEAVGANILGTVMNNEEGVKAGGYYGYTY